MCSAFRKPNNLVYSTYLGGCSELLAHLGAASTDTLLPHFIRLQRLQEEIKHVFQYDEPRRDELDAAYIETIRHRFEEELEHSNQLVQTQVGTHGKQVLTLTGGLKLTQRLSQAGLFQPCNPDLCQGDRVPR